MSSVAVSYLIGNSVVMCRVRISNSAEIVDFGVLLLLLISFDVLLWLDFRFSCVLIFLFFFFFIFCCMRHVARIHPSKGDEVRIVEIFSIKGKGTRQYIYHWIGVRFCLALISSYLFSRKYTENIEITVSV